MEGASCIGGGVVQNEGAATDVVSAQGDGERPPPFPP
jgi:hypothetical protein